MRNPALALLFFLGFTLLSFGQLKVEKTYIENSTNPIGIDAVHPRFTWKLLSDARNSMQTAYEIKVATKIENLKTEKNLSWHSGKIISDNSVHIPYEGEKLLSNTPYYYQIRVWDNKSKASNWSSIQSWHTGFFNPEKEFIAQWITIADEKDTVNRPSPLFRKEFSFTENKKIKKATAFITSHGMYEAELNGKRIGDYFLAPGWTSYDQRLQYQVYDVTAQLNSQGKNAIGITLGNGWYRDYLAWGGLRNHYGNDIALLFQLEISFEDGSSKTVVSDSSWKSFFGPIQNSEIYDGELYDATKELQDWTKSGFDDSSWSTVTTKDFSKDILIATENEPIRKQEEFKIKNILKTPEGDTVVDFGQNLVGWVQLNVSGKKGDIITLSHAEVLDKNGNFYVENLREADQKVIYVLNGSSNQILEPHFTFQGFRYVKVEGFPGTLAKESLKAIALYSDMENTGNFTTSNPMINQLQHNIQWGQKGNFLDVPTDCPQRDERLGWTGDAQAFFRTAAYNMNVENFFSKWLKDVKTDQLPNGSVPFVVPNVLGPNAGGSAGWGDVATIIPWEMYELYGDKQVLENQYESMKAWVGYITAQSTDNLWKTGFHFGDWLFYTPDDDRDGKAAITDKYLIAQCFYAHSTQLLLNAAQVLEKKEDVAHYNNLLNNIRDAFQKEYVTSSGRLVSGTQTAYVLALQFDMLPEAIRPQAAERLVSNIVDYGYHLTTGFLGTPYLNHVLSRFGQEGIAYKLLLQDTYPSWLYPVTQGATTIWERWDGLKPDGTFQTPSMNSYNHYAYGAIGDWMYRNIGGINSSIDGPGYKKFEIRVILGGGLTSASAELNTPYGEIQSSWTYNNNLFVQNINIPVNTTADVFIPSDGLEWVTENKKPITKIKNMEVVGFKDSFVHVKLGSGSYSFSSTKTDKAGDASRKYSGTYKTVEGFLDTIEIVEENNKLFLVVNGEKSELIASTTNENLFIATNNPNASITFQKDGNGNVNTIKLSYNGMEFTGVKQ